MHETQFGLPTQDLQFSPQVSGHHRIIVVKDAYKLPLRQAQRPIKIVNLTHKRLATRVNYPPITERPNDFGRIVGRTIIRHHNLKAVDVLG
jgi:hypothetical protein